MRARDPDELRRRLEAWLAERLEAPDLKIVDLDTPKAAGFSTESVYVRVSFTEGGRARSRRLMVRFENLGPGLFYKADIRLQYDMIAALHRHPQPPTPAPVGLETDRAVLGRGFSVVECVPGRVAPQVPNYNVAGWVSELDPAERNRLWRNGIAALAQVHRLDWRDGFEFLDRAAYGAAGLDQLLGWTEAWYEWVRAGRRHPLVDEALARLRRGQPRTAPVEVLWGDCAPNNILFAEDLGVAAVLDWEAAALGPGEADLAWWMLYDEYQSDGFGIPRLPGLPGREETMAVYETALGRPLGDMAYYDLLAATRNAILSMRSVSRQAELGRIPADSAAATHNPPARMLAGRLGIDDWEVGEPYHAYLKAVIGAKLGAAAKTAGS